MNRVFAIADNIFSPLGTTTAENFNQILAGNSGIRAVDNLLLSPQVFYASLFNKLSEDALYTRFEKICITSITDALKNANISLSSPDTVLIISTTKGNIELIENNKMNEELRQRVSLFETAKKIAAHFNAVNKPLVVSNACISGVLAVLIAKRLLQSGAYRHAVVTGADVLSRFIISGFQSLHAISNDVCKPFDKNRNGINLGECAATMVLSTEPQNAAIEIRGGASSNDANHISGPSRTGHELAHAVSSSLKEGKVSATDLSFISAHGTATLYNDEMEAKAFAYSGLAEVPLHSLKGHYGHTLGAAGVVESIITYHSLLQQVVLPSKNFAEHGVSEKVNVNNVLRKSDKHHALKTASGFGGCNAAVLYSTT